MTRLFARALLAVALLLPTGSVAATVAAEATAPTASKPAATAGDDKIAPRLERKLADAGSATYWVRFAAMADLTAASAIDDWEQRGQMVADALRQTAEESQADVRRRLDAAGVDYQAFWATNAIRIESGSADLAKDLAAVPEVQGLYPTQHYARPEPVEKPAAAVRAAGPVEWGIGNINADDVWEQYGTTGDDIVVANIDTGVQYDHPALVGQYRGNNGDGTFTHDYNWFDAAGACADDAPCTTHWHGTHTMGTLVGDGGEGNRIGVAPGAKWIAADGCCPSDAALIASGQWMLEPTDSNGENPDAGMRPHIINNSWGSDLPSEAPFMEDISRAWAASGIFAVWSNGNEGDDCATSSSPGSRIVNYSVGAYDSDNHIADFSSRGPGESGEVKPNISAPGVAVRSAVPGDAYALSDGTSMAAPHVAGTVALLWSAAPALVGDVDTTLEMLNQTAIDTPDDQCGGTAEDNNVYGEGRLDALALLDLAPIGETGTLATTVTDAATGEPIPNAELTVSGPVDRERVTRRDGAYAMPLPPGDYTITASAFGYHETSVEVTVTAGQTATAPIGMEAMTTVQVRGQVTDGGGQGWPVYAKVTVDGMPNGTVFTDPVTGRYSLRLPIGATYSVTVEPQYDGYQAVTTDVEVGDRDLTQSFELPVDTESCLAAGYAYNGLSVNFDTGKPPGWTVVDHNGNGGWRFDDPYDRGNQTGGTGGFAVGQSPGNRIELDTSLVSPPIDLRGHTEPVVSFRQDFPTVSEFADVDVSLDGGETWETVLRQERSVRKTETIVPIPQAAGRDDVRVRFHYSDATYNSWWWQVDDVFIGTRECAPVDGGLVVGHVRDRNTGAPLNGVKVSGPDPLAPAVTTASTPDDPGLPDGFYTLFVEGGDQAEVTASATPDGYQPMTGQVAIDSGWVRPQNFDLAAGRLEVDSDPTATVRMGKTASRTVTITNTGSAPTSIGLGERTSAFEMLAAGTNGQSNESPWVELPNYPFRIMDNVVGEYAGKVYSFGGVDREAVIAKGFRYDPLTMTWTPIAPLPEARENAAGAFIGDRFYVTGGWSDEIRPAVATYVYNPAHDNWRVAADAPVAAAASGQAVLDGKLYLVGGCTNACDLNDVRRYDPKTDTWDVLADYPEGVGHPACGGIDGKLYCTGGQERDDDIQRHTHVYDPETDTWTQLADLPIPLWGSGYTAAAGRLLVSGGVTTDGVTRKGFAYEPSTDSWLNLPSSNHATYRGGSTCGLYRVGGTTGGFSRAVYTAEMLPSYGDCAPSDVSWLALNRKSATLAPGESLTVRVDFDAQVPQPGTYRSGIWIREDTPYLAGPIDVTMQVEPPKQWGKLAGTVEGIACDGTRAPLDDVTVQVESWTMSLTLTTEADGGFGHWVDRRANPLTVVVAKDGWKPQSRTVRITSGDTATTDFALRPSKC